MDTKLDRQTETDVIKFTQSLKQGMEPEEVLELYKSLEKEHLLIESKLLVTRTIFFKILESELTRDAPPTEDAHLMFR
jgi:hypothetical protein